jgi:hypothetical protein
MELNELAGSPLLNEHQAPMQTEGELKDTPEQDEKELVAKVNKLFDKARKHRKKYDSKWMDYYKFFRGKQWKEERPAYRASAVFNKIFRVLQSNVAIRTDARPKFEFLPPEPGDREFCQILNELAQADWEQKNWLLELTTNLFDDEIYGTAHAEVGFDPEYNDGVGDVCFKGLDNFYCFPDPNCFDVNDPRCDFFIYAEPIDVNVLKREYPEKAGKLKADLGEFVGSDKTSISTDVMKAPTENLAYTDESYDGYSVKEDKALKITCWLYDDEVLEDEKEETQEDGSVVKKSTKRLKYPNGRKIVMTSKVLLEDKPNEFDDGKIPVIKKQNYLLPHEYWGISELENLEGPQTHFNKVMSFTLDVLHLMGNPIWVVDNASGVDTDNLFNRPGMVVEKNPNTEVRREEGVQLQPYVLNLAQMIEAEFDELAATSEVSQGIRPEGVTAAKAIEALQDTAQTRLRLKSRVLDAYLQQFGQMYVSRVMQFKTAPQVYRITNSQGAMKYFKFHVEDVPVMGEPSIDPMTGAPLPPQPMVDEMGQPVTEKIGRYREMTADPMSGGTVAGDEKVFKLQAKYDVRVQTGSALPFAKTEKVNTSFQLFDRGIIDAEEVLKATDYPNWEAVLARMQMKAEQQAMAQAQMAMPQPAPGPDMGGGDTLSAGVPM